MSIMPALTILASVSDVPYISFAKWAICLFLIGGSIWELRECVYKKKFMNGLFAIIGIIITILMVPSIFKV